MVKNNARCLFCESTEKCNSPYEDTIFNDKRFEYLKCGDCKLVFVNPLPDMKDFELMYPTSYQGELAANPTGVYNWLFDDVEKCGNFVRVLDYGCGNGNFVIEAISKGYETTGVEFNKDLVNNLKKAMLKAKFLTVTEFLEKKELYDIIFLGNVLEHLTDPVGMLKGLKSHLQPNGLLILEGPIEDNFTLAGAFRRWFFSRRKKAGKKVSHFPRHIFYANYNNQIDVLNRTGFEMIKYKVWENAWPFSATLSQIRSLKDLIFFIIAKTSIMIGYIIPKNGNVFFYIGKSTHDTNCIKR